MRVLLEFLLAKADTAELSPTDPIGRMQLALPKSVVTNFANREVRIAILRERLRYQWVAIGTPIAR
jgi:hypothetical protein